MSNRSQAYATTSFGWRGIESSRNSRISDARLVDFTAYHLNFRGDCQTPRSILSNYWIIIVKQFPPSPGNASTGTVHAHDCQVMRGPKPSASRAGAWLRPYPRAETGSLRDRVRRDDRAVDP